MTPPAQATLPLLHRFLGIGQLLLLAAFVAIRMLGVAPALDGPPSFQNSVVYGMAGITVVMLFVAFFVLKPRVPERRGGQSVAEYWTTPESATKVLPVWFLCEGAGVVSVIGYFLTGAPVALLMAAIALTAFWLLGPNAFAKP